MSEAIALRSLLHELVDPNSKNPPIDSLKKAALEIFDGLATPAQVGALLMALRKKGETRDDLVAIATAMRERSEKISLLTDTVVIDMCGTGGDRAGTFNISTTASFVVAAADVVVPKHGNRAASSKCGSADVLEALGAVITLSPSASQKVLDQVGICFLFAPIYHPAMKHVGPARRELGFPTIFNMLGPLTNPAGARRQLIGVGNETAYELYPDVLMKLNAERVLVVRGEGGLDEATPYGTTRCREIKNGEVNDFTLTPEELGRGTFGLAELKAGEDAAANGEILKAVISGADKSGKREAVIWNAGLGLYVADKAASPAEGLKLAEEILDSGKAIEKLEQYIAATQSTE